MNAISLLTLSGPPLPNGDREPPEPVKQAYIRDFCASPHFCWKTSLLLKVLLRDGESPEYQELYDWDSPVDKDDVGDDGQYFAFPSPPNSYHYNEKLFDELLELRRTKKEHNSQEQQRLYEELRDKYVEDSNADCTLESFNFHRRLVWNAHIGDTVAHPSKFCPFEADVSQDDLPCLHLIKRDAPADLVVAWLCYLIRHIISPSEMYLNGYMVVPHLQDALVIFVQNNVLTTQQMSNFFIQFLEQKELFSENLALSLYTTFVNTKPVKRKHEEAYKILKLLPANKNPMVTKGAPELCCKAFLDISLDGKVPFRFASPEYRKNLQFHRQLVKALPLQNPTSTASAPKSTRNRSRSRPRGKPAVEDSDPEEVAEEEEEPEEVPLPESKKRKTEHVQTSSDARLCSDPSVRCVRCISEPITVSFTEFFKVK
jgi:hypothetical protein